MQHSSPTERFSDRVSDYVRARPGYPAILPQLLAERCRLPTPGVIADAGSGTGIMTRLMLDRGHRVFAVEPNREMREAAEASLGNRAGFTSVAATAESTGLATASVDMVTAAQAFHWFDRGRVRTEFARILRPGGHAVLVWNDRRLASTAFLRGYEALLVDHCPEYLKVVHRNITVDVLAGFFEPAGFETVILDNAQALDWSLLVARHDSQSYVPKSGHARARLMAHLRALFESTADANGHVVFEYDTRVHFGPLT